MFKNKGHVSKYYVFLLILFSRGLLFGGNISVNKTNVPERWILPATTNVTVMAIEINDSASHPLTNIKIKNLGDLSNSNGISSLKLWYDAGGKNGIWDAQDVLITNAVWNTGNNSWDFAGLGSPGNTGIVDLSGWDIVIDGVSNYTIPAGTIFSNNKYLIICRSTNKAGFESYYGVTIPTNCLFLNSGDSLLDMNGGDSFLIRDGSDVIQDGATISFSNFPEILLDDFNNSAQYSNGFNDLGELTGVLALFMFDTILPPQLELTWTILSGDFFYSYLDDTYTTGVDLTLYDNLYIEITGDTGGEQVDICLDDINFTYDCISITLPAGMIMTNISLTNFNINLDEVGALLIEPTSPNGTIYIDRISFTGPPGYREQRNDPESDPGIDLSWSNGISVCSGAETQDSTYSGIVISEVHFNRFNPDINYDFIEIYNDSGSFPPSGVDSGTNIIITMDLSAGAIPDRYFKAYIETNDIICSTGSNGPASAVSNDTRQTVVDTTIMNITKYDDSITLGTSGTNTGNISSAIPGATITYCLKYTNTGAYDSFETLIKDIIPSGTTYMNNGLKSGNTADTYQTAKYSTDIQNDDRSSYFSGQVVFSVTNGNAPSQGGRMPAGYSGKCWYRATIDDLAAGSLIYNTSIITGYNFNTFNSTTNIITVATLYGGRFSYIENMTNESDKTNYFSCSITNKGNVPTTYKLSIPYTNSTYYPDWSRWDIAIVSNNNDMGISVISNLQIGSNFKFRVRVIPSGSVTNNSWLDFRIRAQADNDINATNYWGDDGNHYGGDIGENWNGTNGKNPGYIYQQNNPEIRLFIKDPPIGHFDIVHDGAAIINDWENIAVAVKDTSDEIMGRYEGTITLYIATGPAGAVDWTNHPGNQGKFSNIGSGRCLYIFSTNDNGVITLRVTDNTAESLDIEISEITGVTDSDISPQRLKFTEDLDHFEVVHNGIGFINIYKPIVISVKDSNNDIVPGFTGTVTLDLAPGFTGTINWKTNIKGNNGILVDLGGGKATYEFIQADYGVVTLRIEDNMLESIDIEVRNVTGKTDNDMSPQWLRFYEQIFYVNDDSTIGDIYTTAPGNNTNHGLSPDKPKRTLITGLSSPSNDLFNAYDLEPGAIVYIDTGIYYYVRIGGEDSGDSTGHVTLQGAGINNTIFTQIINLNRVVADPASYIKIRSVRTKAITSSGSSLGNFIIESNYICGSSGAGIIIESGSNTIIRDNIICSNGMPLGGCGIEINGGGGPVFIENNEFIDASSSGAYVINIDNAPDSIIRGNTTHDCSAVVVIFLDPETGSCDGCQILNNTIHHTSSGSGRIGVASKVGGANNILIQGNIFHSNVSVVPALYGCIWIAQGNTSGIICKNIIYGNDYNGIFVDNSVSPNSWKIEYNTIYDNTEYGINADADIIIKNCITAGNNNGGINATAGTTVSNSCINDGVSGGVSLGLGCITDDPLFVNEATNNFHLRWNSPCQNSAAPNIVPACMGYHTASVIVSNEIAGIETRHNISFVVKYSQHLPADSIIDITYPAGFKLGGVNNVTTTSRWGGTVGSFTPMVIGQTVRITRSGGNLSAAGETENLILSVVTNTLTKGTNYDVIITLRSNNGKVIDQFLSNKFRIADLDHFEVVHDGIGFINIYEPVVIYVKDTDNGNMQGFTGIVTLDLTPGATGTINWTTNITGNNGTLSDLGGGKATYNFTLADKGVVTLRIKDNTLESMDIEVRNVTGNTDNDMSPQWLRFYEQIFYVNDDSTVGDIYTTAPGNNTNHGLSPDKPKKTLISWVASPSNDLLMAYDLEPGAIVYIDTGIYPGIAVGGQDSGNETGHVTFQGAGINNTYLTQSISLNGGMVADPSSYIKIRSLRTKGIWSLGSSLGNFIIESNYIRSPGAGIIIESGSNTIIRDNIICSNGMPLGGCGIEINGGGGPVFIENNEFIDASSPGSGVILVDNAPDSIIRENHVHHGNTMVAIILYPENGNCDRSQILNNIIHHTISGNMGVSAVGTANNVLIQGNIIYSNTISVPFRAWIEAWGGNNSGIICNNLIYGNGSSMDGIHIGNNVSPNKWKIIYNTIYNNNGYGIDADVDVTIKNCITKGNASGGIDATAGTTVSNSCINDGVSGGVSLGPGCTTNNPLFVNEATNNLHLRWNSPCQNSAASNIVAGSMGYYTASVVVSNESVNIGTKHRISFVVNYSQHLPADSIIDITYPAGFKLGGVNNVTTTSRWGGTVGSFTPMVIGQTVRITRSGGNLSAAGETENLILSFITNASTVGTNYDVYITLRSNNGKIIDQFLSNKFRLIFEPFNHFEIWHDTQAPVNVWEKIYIMAKNKDGLIVTNYTGNITLSVIGEFDEISWTNVSAGNFNDFGPVDDRATCSFELPDKGIITLLIKDNTIESVDIEVRNTTGVTDFGGVSEVYLNFWGTTIIEITKSISNITLGGSNSLAIPGATIFYVIKYSNAGLNPGIEAVIHDAIPPPTIYSTNSDGGTAVAWTVQWSTNVLPSFVYNNISDWLNIEPASIKIKWIRWKKLKVESGEKGALYFKAIIK